MGKLGWKVDTVPFQDRTPHGTKTFANIIATLPIGRNFRNQQADTDTHLNNRVVFACHYDSKFFAEFNFVGAVDSAVPCAMLIDMAKFLQENFDKTEFDNVIQIFVLLIILRVYRGKTNKNLFLFVFLFVRFPLRNS
jgi:glutaminyl-peptide cyclotransferase